MVRLGCSCGHHWRWTLAAGGTAATIYIVTATASLISLLQIVCVNLKGMMQKLNWTGPAGSCDSSAAGREWERDSFASTTVGPASYQEPYHGEGFPNLEGDMNAGETKRGENAL